MKTHKDLDVWKNAMEMVTDIYRISKKFPKDELYGLTSQIRRSAISVPSNIAEGAGRKHNREYIQFLYIARGSLSELETQLMISRNLGYLINESYLSMEEKITIIRKQIIGLIKHLESKT